MKIVITDADTGNELLTSARCAEVAGVSATTWTGYVARGRAPEPITHLNARTPLWDATEVRAWNNARPGRGARTDLKANPMIRTAPDFDAVATALRALDGHSGTWAGINGETVTQTYRLEVTNDYISLYTTNPERDTGREVTMATLEPDGKLFIIDSSAKDHIETNTAWYLAQPIRAELDAIIDMTDPRT